MADEIKITVTDIGGKLTNGKILDIKFDVIRRSDDAVIVSGYEYRTKGTSQAQLKAEVEERAQKFYAEYEDREQWLGRSLPVSWNIDKA